MGRVSSENFYRATDIYDPTGLPNIPTIELERLYQSTGGVISGPTEVRYAWKYNDLKPRVYYAQGATAWNDSRYIRNPMNSLAKAFACTNPNTRYNTNRLNPICDTDSFSIYDYVSFTTKLTEFRYFMEELAEFTRDVNVKVLDTYHGIIDKSLGDLFDSYNTSCNYYPEMDLSRILSMTEPHIVTCSTAGLLGIYGNIVGCTVLHGWHLIQVCGSPDLCNCVGDDAQMVLRKDDGFRMQDAQAAVEAFGDVSRDKWKIWDVDSPDDGVGGWHYVKRPIDRIEGHLFTGNLVDFPNLIYVLPITDSIHTVDSPENGRLSFLSQCRKLLGTLHRISDSLDEEEIEITLHYLEICYRILHLPLEGRLPGHSIPGVETQAIPKITRDSIGDDWFDVLWRDRAQSCGRLPRHGACSELGAPYAAGDTMFSSSDPILNLAEDMGFLSKRSLWEEVVIQNDLYDDFRSLSYGEVTIMYEYTWIYSPPHWWYDAVPFVHYT